MMYKGSKRQNASRLQLIPAGFGQMPVQGMIYFTNKYSALMRVDNECVII